MNLLRWRLLTDRIEKAERDGNNKLRGRLVRRKARLEKRITINSMINSVR